MPEEKTVVAGAESADKTTVADPSTAADKGEKKADPPAEGEQPWHKDPRFKQDLGLLKAAKSLMEKNSIDSIEDLVELAESGKKVRGKQVDLDRLDEIAEKAAKLDKYEAYWRDQEEKNKRSGETVEETLARTEHQLRQRDAAEHAREAKRQQAETAKRAIHDYESEVKSLIEELEMPKEQRGFVTEFFGVGNPFNDIDITDKKAVKRLVTDGLKKKEAYDQAVIAAYLKTKGEIPKVGSATGAVTTETKSKIMLKDARKLFLEQFGKSQGG
jgi:hypothetical protein